MRWYLRYSLSFRDVEERLSERSLKADLTTIWRWVQRYGPELEARLRRHLKPTHRPWRVDETYRSCPGSLALSLPSHRFQERSRKESSDAVAATGLFNRFSNNR